MKPKPTYNWIWLGFLFKYEKQQVPLLQGSGFAWCPKNDALQSTMQASTITSTRNCLQLQSRTPKWTICDKCYLRHSNDYLLEKGSSKQERQQNSKCSTWLRSHTWQRIFKVCLKLTSDARISMASLPFVFHHLSQLWHQTFHVLLKLVVR